MTKQGSKVRKADSRNFFHFAALVANRLAISKQNIHLVSLKRSKILEPKLQKCLASFENIENEHHEQCKIT